MREKYIARMARKWGLDPKAVLAIAAHEGLSGGIGDGGHAFGPFQMNDAGGVLTNAPASHHSNKYAWSNKGINQALRLMASTSARGKTGRAAITALVNEFERPADRASEINDALSKYGKVAGGGTGAIAPDNMAAGFQQHGMGSQVHTKFDAETYRKQAGMLMMQQAQQTASGQPPQVDPATGRPVNIVDQLNAARKAATVKVAGNMDLGAKGGGPALGGSGFGDKLVKLASKQLGQPYVWGGESRGEGGFDCSGLVQWAAGAMGVHLPRTTGELMNTGKRVSLKNIKKGDLLVNNHHVVIYAGGGKVIAAPHTGTNVQWQDASSFLGGDYQARRVG